MPNLSNKWPRPKALILRTIIERLQICTCGSNAHWICIYELLQEAKNHTEKGFYKDQWFEFGAKVLGSWGLTDHGTGIGFAWITEDGELLLEFLEDFGIDDDGHPEWIINYGWDEVEDDNDCYAIWACGQQLDEKTT